MINFLTMCRIYNNVTKYGIRKSNFITYDVSILHITLIGTENDKIKIYILRY